MDALFFAIVLLVSLFAAFIDVIAGGSGLIVLPALAALGVPLITAIATNRAYILVFVLIGAIFFARKKIEIDFKLVAILSVARLAGNYFGATFAIDFPPEQLKMVVGALMACALGSIILLRTREKKMAGRKSAATVAVLFAALAFLGVYEGIAGGGSGTITRILLVIILGMTAIEAAAADLAIAFVGSLSSTAVFVSSGLVDFTLLFPMIIGGAIGAYFGTSMAVKKGEEWTQKILYVVAIVLIATLLIHN